MKREPLKREIHKSYEELLQTTEWRDFSKAVKLLRGNQCENCEGGSDDIEVHHLGYRAGTKPWEYPESELLVLCKDCHSEFHEFADRLWNEVLKSRNMWVIHECFKAVRETLDKHQS